MPEANYTKDDYLAVMQDLKALPSLSHDIDGLKIVSDNTTKYPFFIFLEPHAYLYNFKRAIQSIPGLISRAGEPYSDNNMPMYDTINSIVEINDLQKLKQFIAEAKSYKITNDLVKISAFNQYNNFQNQIDLVNSVFERENARTKFIPGEPNRDTLDYVISDQDPRWKNLEKLLMGAAATKAIQYSIDAESGSSMKVIKITAVNLQALTRAKNRLDTTVKFKFSDLQAIVDKLKKIYPDKALIQDLVVSNGDDSYTRPFPHIRSSTSHNISEATLMEYYNDLEGISVVTKKNNGAIQLILDIDDIFELKTKLNHAIIEKIAPNALSEFKQIDSKIKKLQDFKDSSPFESIFWREKKPQHMQDTSDLISHLESLKDSFLKGNMQQTDFVKFTTEVRRSIRDYDNSLLLRNIDPNAAQMGQSEIVTMNKITAIKTFLEKLNLPTSTVEDKKAVDATNHLVNKLSTLHQIFEESSMNKKDFENYKKQSIKAIEDSFSNSPLDKIKSLFQKIKNFLTNDTNHQSHKINFGEQHKEKSQLIKDKLAGLHQDDKPSKTLVNKNRMR